MSAVGHLKHEYDKVKCALHGLFTRMEMAWMKLISELEPQEFRPSSSCSSAATIRRNTC
jgi:hypothetical protein